MLINNPLALTVEYFNEILGVLGIGLWWNLCLKRSSLKSSEKKHFKKYFTNLEPLR